MYNLAVKIVRFVDDHQPGWVASEFVDAEGRRHSVVDKVPVLGFDYLDASSKYPQSSSARCEVLERWRDGLGRELARISLASPDGIETTEGLTEFVVLSTQISVSTEGGT
jgi:hypothetical protein